MSDPGAAGCFPYPIGVVAFNRPEHIATIIEQTMAQTLPPLDGYMYFSIDGYAGSYDEARGRPDRRNASKELLAERLPAARVREHAVNVSVAASIIGLERWVFEETGAPWIVVLEDDIDQDPQHLQRLAELIARFDGTPEVGMVTASGECAIERSRGDDSVYPAVGSRAYAIRREYFERKRPFTDFYLQAIAGHPYHQLHFRDVARPLANIGLLALAPNQDFVAFALLQRLDSLYVTTGRRYVRHVGIRGMHFDGAGAVDHALFATSTSGDGAGKYEPVPGITMGLGAEGRDATELEHLRAESKAAFAREFAHVVMHFYEHPEDYLRMSSMLQRIPRRLGLALRRHTPALMRRIPFPRRRARVQ